MAASVFKTLHLPSQASTHCQHSDPVHLGAVYTGRGRGRGDASSAGRGGAAVAPARLPAAPGLAMLGGDVEDEYDPARPNDYDDVVKERERLRKDAEMEELRQQRLKEAEKTREADLAREVRKAML